MTVGDTDRDEMALVELFEVHRTKLRAIAMRMLGSHADADDVLQDAWLRVSRAGTEGVENVGGWLTTIVTRLCLNVLRVRTHRREDPLEVHVPDPIIGAAGTPDPEEEAVLADAVGLALDVVLDTLSPAERISFVLHDLFDLPFDDIAVILERTPAATRQLASRARRRVQGATPVPDPDTARTREVVAAFFTAARAGDLEGLLQVLDPDVLLRADGGSKRAAMSALVRGAEKVAGRAMMFRNRDAVVRPASINGGPGIVAMRGEERISVMAFVVSGGRIVEIDVLADPDRLARLDLSVLG